ncbi:MAG TPA: alpha/beta hydrolase-fold protein [Gemmatimonadales bacterium]|nr:alpha/beta hydrolase-fold protein [Gemmatimonadales bacterium]
MRFAVVGLTVAASLLSGTPLLAQSSGAPATVSRAPEPVVIGERMSFRSALLGKEYPVYIYRPDNYDRGSARYPVLYLLDGEAHFHHATGVVQFLAAQGRIPQMIVVGVGNTDRTRDLTPPTEDPRMSAAAGGADRFLRFLTDELVPHVDRTYRTLDYRVLAGHSFGGLFALHALVTRPSAFGGYVAISPSVWWNGQALAKAMPAFLAVNRDLRASLYMTTGNEGGEMLTGAERLAEILERHAPKTLQWEFHHLPAESHGSIPHRSLYDGLETMFADLRIESDTLSRSVADLERRYEELSLKYGYRIPVTEPQVNSFGYSLLRRGLHAEAIAVFRVNTERFPRSANTFDSLGDAYEAAGDLESARKSYARAVELARQTGDPVLNTSAEKLSSVTSKLATPGVH